MSSKTGPKASHTAALLAQYGITQSSIVKGTGISRSAISRLCAHAEWPQLDVDLVKTKIETYLRSRGLSEPQMTALCLSLQLRALKNRPHLPTALLPAAALPVAVPPIDPTPDPTTETDKEEAMLLQNHVLEIETLDHFKLERNPFVDDINTRADVFASPGTRRVRAAMLNAATNHGFIAVVGESGSGKTTLRKELEERIRIENLPIRIIKPYIVGMSPSDTHGKAMKSGAIADAIARTLAPSVVLKSNPDARFAQVQLMLEASVSVGYSNLIIIEEAHRLPQATLRHLKGFMELESGMRRVLGVCLIGQPELDDLLGAQNREIREIVQRCNRVALGPMVDDLEAYIQHKFERAGVKASTVLAPNAYEAIAQKLRHKPRNGTMADVKSVCYPLMVNNLLCKVMNSAAAEKWPQVDAQVIAGC